MAARVECVDTGTGGKNASYVIFEEDEQKSREEVFNNPATSVTGVSHVFATFKTGKILPPQ